MEIVIKASAIAAVSALCILLIKKNNGEIGLAVAIAAAAVICFAAAQLFGSIMELVRYAIGQTGLSSALFMPIIKCVGIAIIVKIGSGLCKDAGQSGIASSLEMLGSAAALFTAIPIISSLLETIGGLI